MPEEHEYLTKAKFDEFKKELEYLKVTKRKEVAESLEYAKALGNLSENAEYHEARDMQAATEDRIAHLEFILKSATVISSHDTHSVTIGSVITVEHGKDKKTYTIVSSEEADSKTGKISVKSPLGSAAYARKRETRSHLRALLVLWSMS